MTTNPPIHVGATPSLEPNTTPDWEQLPAEPDAVKAALGLPATAAAPFVAEAISEASVPAPESIDHHATAAALKDLARQYVERADQAHTFAESDEWHQQAGQLRLIAQLTDTSGPDSAYVAIGAAWLTAGENLLAARLELEAQQ